MGRLEYTFTNDTLFKMLFAEHTDLLKSLVSELLEIPGGSIGEFFVTNPEVMPENLGDKFCRLDINMTVDGQRVDIEVQVNDEGDFPERSLYYWAREYSSALPEGGDYADLPRVVVIGIVAFRMFACEGYHSEFLPLEATRHERLTDRMALHYFELPKLPKAAEAPTGRELWLALLNAKTEEDLARIEKMEVPEMSKAIKAYRAVTAADEFKEMERLRFLARSNEAAALRHARDEERAKWQGVVAVKDAELAEQSAELAEQSAVLAEQSAVLAEQNALIAELKARLGKNG